MLFRSKTAIQIEIVKTIFENSKHSKVSKTIFKLKIIALFLIAEKLINKSQQLVETQHRFSVMSQTISTPPSDHKSN